MGAKTKFDSAENKRLRLVLNARVHRGQPGAAELKKQIDGLKGKEERFQSLRENLVVDESSRPTLDKKKSLFALPGGHRSLPSIFAL